MSPDNRKDEKLEQEIAKGLEGIEEELAQFVGTLDSPQKHILVELARLHHSLRGPETILDKGNYSRPIPPRSATPLTKAVGR
jgi:hypothetical protein